MTGSLQSVLTIPISILIASSGGAGSRRGESGTVSTPTSEPRLERIPSVHAQKQRHGRPGCSPTIPRGLPARCCGTAVGRNRSHWRMPSTLANSISVPFSGESPFTDYSTLIRIEDVRDENALSRSPSIFGVHEALSRGRRYIAIGSIR